MAERDLDLARVPRGGAPENGEEASSSAQESATAPLPLIDGAPFDGVASVVYDEPESETTLYRVPFLNAAFAVSSLLLLILTVVAIYQDYDREWKHYQYEWHDWQAGELARKLDAEEARIGDELATLESDLESATRSLDSRKLRRLEAELVDERNVRDQLDTQVKFLKSEMAKEKFVYEEARKHVMAAHGGLTAQANQELAALERAFNEKYTYPLEELEKKLENAKTATHAAQHAVDSEIAQQAEIEKSIDELTRQRDLLATALDGVRASAKNTIRDLPLLDFFKPSAQIHKVVLPDLTEPLNFMDVGRVDRCKSCHVNIDSPDPAHAAITMEDKAHGGRVYRSHPRLDLYLSSTSPHPYADFGCTTCHYGDGHSLTFFTSAHWPNDEEQRDEWEAQYHWHPMHHQDYPMLPMPYITATCAKCHDEESRVPGAELYNKGRDLVETYGCFGCHKLAGFEEYRKAGPDLSFVAQKTSREFLYKWIRNPAHFRPSTKMPRFFDLANSSGAIEAKAMVEERAPDGSLKPRVHEFERRNGVEALAIATYIHSTSRQRDDVRELSGLTGNAEAGKLAFQQSGCLGCHPIASEGWTESDHGPDLGTVGSKLDRRWLADWIVNPSKHFPETRMPRLRIELDDEGKPSAAGEQKLADLVAYLMSLRDESFEQERALVLDPENRRILKDIAFDYCSRTETRADSRAKIDAYYKPEGLNGNASEEATLARGDEAVLRYVGEKLINRYGCFGCHEGIAGFEDVKPIGTELTEHGIKPVDRLDFGQWGHQPSGEHALEHTRIDWFTAKLGNTRLFDMIPLRKVDSQGEVVYEASDRRIQKTPEELLKMPLFPFHDDPEQVKAVVTFLLSRLPDPIPLHKRSRLTDEKRVIEDGRRIVRDFNCQGCHRIGADAQQITVAKERSDPQTDAPRFSFQDTDEALATRNEIERETWLSEDLVLGDFVVPKDTLISHTFLRPVPGSPPPEGDEEVPTEEYSVVEIAEHYWNANNVPDWNRVLKVRGYDEGRIRKYFGVEATERAKAAPLLRLQGERTNGDWLFEFLLDVKTLRPWLTLRMPSFNMTHDEASKIVAMFKAQSETPYPHEKFDEHTFNRQMTLAGLELFRPAQPEDENKAPRPERLGCAACHPRGDVLPTNPDKANWGPDLSLARARLRPTWIRSWFLNPQYFMPGTNMPKFWVDYDVFESNEANPPELQKWIEMHMPALESAGMQIQRPDWKNEMEALLQYLMHMHEVDE